MSSLRLKKGLLKGYAIPMGLSIVLLVTFVTLNSKYFASSGDLSVVPLNKRDEEGLQKCGFQGDSDLYGLGIRIGLYLQCMAQWLSYNTARRRRTEQNVISIVFLMSMMLILFISSAREGIHAAEAFTLLQMVILMWYMGPILDGNRTCYLLQKEGLEAKLICEVIIGLGIAYNTWFWWIGLDRLEPTTCGTFGLILFWKFDLYGGIRIFNKVTSIIMSLEVPHRIVWHCVGLTLLRKTRLIRKARMPDNSEQVGVEIKYRADKWDVDVSELTEEKTCNIAKAYEINLQATKPNHSRRPTSQQLEINDAISEWKPIRFTEADEFITDITRLYDQQLSELTRGYYPKWGITVVIPKLRSTIGIFCRATWDFCRLAFQLSSRFWSLIVLLLALRAEGRLRLRVEYPIAVSSIVRDERFGDYDWQVLYLATQRRAAQVPRTSPLGRGLTASAIGLLFCTFQILAVELTIRWNHISGLAGWLSVSQFVPLVGGASSLCRVMYSESRYIIAHGRLSLLDAEASRKAQRQESEVEGKA